MNLNQIDETVILKRFDKTTKTERREEELPYETR